MIIPPRYKNAKYADVSDSIKKLITTIPKTLRGIYIHGGVGTGKTHSVYAIGNYIQNDPKAIMKPAVRIYNATDFLRRIKEDYDRNRYDKEFIFDKTLEFRGLLIIDDIGAEKLTEWVAETFYLIVNKRYEECLPTIFTSNFSIPELADRIGDRIVSRIVETCDIVEMSGDDKRLKKARKIKAE